MRQFEIWWAKLPSPVGKRPVLLLTRSPAYEYLNKIIVAEVTTRIRSIPQEVKLGQPEGLARSCVANLDNVHVVSKAILTKRVGHLPEHRHQLVKRALGFALDWDELKVL